MPLRLSALTLAMMGGTTAATTAQAQVALDPMVVTAAGYAQQVASAPASISVVTREELAKRQYRDVTDALIDVPGVLVTGGGPGDTGRDINFRGMPAEYTTILVDGMPISSRETRPNGSAGFEQDWLPPLYAIERIEVIRGPMSTLYGADAMGGVINIITRDVQEEWHANVRIGATLQEHSDSGNSQQTEFYTTGPLIRDVLGVEAFGRYSTRQEDEFVDGYEDKELLNGTARMTWQATEHQDFVFEAGKTKQERTTTVGKTIEEAEGNADSTNRYETRRYSLRHEGKWGFGTSTTYVQQETTDNESRDISVENLEAKSQMVLPFSTNTLSFGASYSKESLEDTTTNRISDLTELDMYQYALFIEDEYYLTDTFSVTAGVRMDDNEEFGEHFSPRLYGVWNLAPLWTLKGGVSTGYKAPGVRDLSPEWGAVSRGGNVYGNPDLEPETSVTKEIGLLYGRQSDLNGSITLFRNDFEDKISRVPCTSAGAPCASEPANSYGNSPTTRINIDEAYTQGVEATLSSPLTETLSIKGAYTYTDSEQESGAAEGEQLTQLPKHLFATTLDWDPAGRFSGWSRLTFRGDQEEYVSSGRSGTTDAIPSYTIVDAGGSWRIAPQANLLFGVYNVFDRDIDMDTYSLLEEGRRYWLAIDLEI
ncbi:iron-regulated outer membrane virulence protein [Salinicola rhizosphaerae]|uniref:Iron-regulated outer membrane virulence protein n=1 Tax=Salinicola rhizosphaerae TaxID=1443141 RepID=A0ABQ3DY22_9GAMM|nr:iron-regulated outer membrane virulence protein [Salinicola rhizosphaerae]